MKEGRKIGLLGGAFDPVHEGHLSVARIVLERFQLDEVLFIPTFYPPHKNRSLTPFAHRLAMLQAALKGMDHMSISALESERQTPSYTVDTLQELHLRLPGCSFFLIMGADMFVEIQHWYRYHKLFELADCIVAARPGVSADQVAGQVEKLPGEFAYDPAVHGWRRRQDRSMIVYLPDLSVQISSTEIREKIAENAADIADYLDPAVLRYIRQHGLYGCTNGHA